VRTFLNLLSVVMNHAILLPNHMVDCALQDCKACSQSVAEATSAVKLSTFQRMWWQFPLILFMLKLKRFNDHSRQQV
jgi:hypothetical protein